MRKQDKLEAYTYALLCAHCSIDYESKDNSYSSSRAGEIMVESCLNLDNWYLYKYGSCLPSLSDIHTMFPEFARQRPIWRGEIDCWWPMPWKNKEGHKKRIEAIERAIQLTEQLPH